MDKIYCNNIPDKQNCQLLYGKNSKLSAADGIEGCPRANRECFRGCMFAQGAGIWLKRSGAGKQEGLLGGSCSPEGTAGSPELFLRANKECLRGCMFAQGAGIRLKRSGAGKQEGLLGVRVRPKEPLAARNSPRGRTKSASESACSPREPRAPCSAPAGSLKLPGSRLGNY